jgi:tetratricopeptide (TPR) repeat protein
VELLRMLGLFDRPADGQEIAALRAAPPIPGLTEHVQGLSEADWLHLLGRLRRARLIALESRHRPDALDAHPLVREHFGQQLRHEHPQAWREGHNRLYEHLKRTAKESPDAIEEMAPLFAAVAHGCQAGRHQEALDEVYWRRIQRGREFYNRNRLGALGAELAALSGFFAPPWRQPVAGLTDVWKSWVLNEAGSCLRALGRLAEAVEPFEASLQVCVAQKVWKGAAIRASHLSELYLTLGDLAQALAYARQSVELADRSGDAFQRMSKRTTLGDALHQAGRLAEAEAAFREAEGIQKESRLWGLAILPSVWGFRYCDLLLGLGQYQDVINRVNQTHRVGQQLGSADLLSIALDHLSLGRAHLLQTLPRETEEGRGGDYTQAAAHLEQAVDGLRQAGRQDMLPLGLLARAELRRVMGALDQARRDLDEALSITTRSGMRLYGADCHLEYTRLYLASGEQEKARESLAKAKAMIEEMGYHWRDGEVAELEKALRPSPPSPSPSARGRGET